MQSLPLVVPKTAFRLKCRFGIHLILEIKDLLVELGMKVGVQGLLRLTWDKSEHWEMLGSDLGWLSCHMAHHPQS